MSSSTLEYASTHLAHRAAPETPSRRVFHLLDEAEPFSERNGGAISRWAANVLQDGDEIIVCPSFDTSWNFKESRLYALPRWRDTNSIHPVLYRMPWALQKRFYLKIFARLLRRTHPGDVLYVHNRPECASVLATVAAAHGITVVLHMHNSHLIRAKRGQLNALKHTPIVFCSEFLRTEVQQKLPNHFEHTALVYNGADKKKFQSTKREAKSMPTVIFTGRLVPDKGVHILLKAMRLLEQREVQAKCQIVGGVGFGDERTTAYLRKLRRMCPANTELVGYKAGGALAGMLRGADVFCCPSVWNDPFPLAPIEAMACGLAVVASRTGGIPEALAHGGGLMVAPNDPVALADALQLVLDDFAYRQQLSREAVASFQQHFVWENVREQYRSFLEALP
jgi:spore coat protein SA